MAENGGRGTESLDLRADGAGGRAVSPVGAGSTVLRPKGWSDIYPRRPRTEHSDGTDHQPVADPLAGRGSGNGDSSNRIADSLEGWKAGPPAQERTGSLRAGDRSMQQFFIDNGVLGWAIALAIASYTLGFFLGRASMRKTNGG